jgi:hypothetical protein
LALPSSPHWVPTTTVTAMNAPLSERVLTLLVLANTSPVNSASRVGF